MSKEKLHLLRKLLTQKKLKGFIVPMNDEFQNEYVPDSAKRMEWLTGFSGSAGTAVVLDNKASVFVDGRYTLQAKQQVDRKIFEIHNIKDINVAEWLNKNCKKGDVIGYDSWLHTEANRERLKNVARNVIFKATENLVDEVWKNQPKPPCGKAFEYPLQYAGESSSSKIKRISSEIKKCGADAMVIAAPDSLCWLLNIRGSDIPQTPFVLAFVLLHKTGKVDLYIDQNKITPPVKKYLGRNVNIFELKNLRHNLQSLAKKGKIMADPALVPAWFFDAVLQAKGQIIKRHDLCQLPKACKNEAEIKGMKNSHIRDGAAVTSFLCWLDENVKSGKIDELSAAEKLLSFRKKQKLFKEPSFNTIAGFGAHGAIVHYRADRKSSAKIRTDNILLLDSGGQYLDGTTDITRTIATGKVTKEQKENFTRVLKGHIAIATVKFPRGTSGAELDVLARRHLWQVGRDYDHGTGHGVGAYLSVHEGPQRISRVSNVPLQEGMVISNEPGYYKEGEYGIRIENLILVRKDKESSKSGRDFLCFETITKAPIDTRLIEKSMLTKDEIEWLKQYHATVAKDLKPLLDAETYKWLMANSVI